MFNFIIGYLVGGFVGAAVVAIMTISKKQDSNIYADTDSTITKEQLNSKYGSVNSLDNDDN